MAAPTTAHRNKPDVRVGSAKPKKRRVEEKRTFRVREPQTTLTDDMAIAPAAIIG